MAKRRGRNQGSVWKEGRKYRAAVTLDSGRITKSFGTIQECNRWIREMQNRRNLGLTSSKSNLTVKEFLTDWLVIHRTKIKSKSGERYTQLARDYVFPHIGELKLSDLRYESIEKFYYDLLQNGLSVRNLHYVHSLIHRSLKDALKRGLVGFKATQDIELPKYEHREMSILTAQEVNQFLMAAERKRNLVLYHLAIKTGMRQGELLGLRWSDLNWTLGTLSIQRQVQRVTGQGMVFMAPKTKAGRRTIPIGKETLRLLERHRSQQQLDISSAGAKWQDLDLIFPSSIGTPQSTSNLLKEFKGLLKKAGVRKIRFHDLRHSAASHMLFQGIQIKRVSEILGHSKSMTTLEIYGHLIPNLKDGVADLMDDLFTPIPIELGESMDVNALSEHL